MTAKDPSHKERSKGDNSKKQQTGAMSDTRQFLNCYVLQSEQELNEAPPGTCCCVLLNVANTCC